jgi:hypothetical protein
MVIDPKDVLPFFTWLSSGALLNWLLVVVCILAGVIGVGWLVALLRYGPFAAFDRLFLISRDAIVDLVRLSPRHVWALARLAIQESIRRRVVVAFAVFIVILLFAGWFLDPGSTDPARLYIDFVLTATSYLVLLLVLFLSAISLPTDIKNRTIFTVVTKPVRSSEIVLGRIIGFMAIGTALLVVMGIVSYVFVVRGLSHTHQITADDLRPVEGSAGAKGVALQGVTSRVNQHHHKVTIEPSGEGFVETEQGHRHPLTVVKNGDKTEYHLGSPEGLLTARVPIYGKLSFLDREGKPSDKGVNVGDEWTYRSYIEGGSLATCVWDFDGITEEEFANGLPVELTIEIFRTYKGDIEKGVPGSLSVRNPRTGKKAEVVIFESKEYATDSHVIPRQLQMPDGEKVDLFKDFVDNGHVQILLQCVAPAQYFGAAQGDMYLRAREASFVLNFIKGYYAIWLQMLLVISLGVMFSTFLSVPVAMLATMGTLLGGFFSDYMYRLAMGQTYGGGPFESIVRILTQQNQTTAMEPGLRTTVALMLDQPAKLGLWVISMILPDFGRFSFSEYVASGFNISGDTLLMYTCRAFAFAIPVFVAGYLCLKNREIGK